jgi:putative ABC transport system substrate-binding protein
VIALGAEILVPIATPTTQALVKENGGRLPIVFIAVTDPVGAGLLTDLQKPGGNLTGVSDAWPYREQLQLMRTIAPKVRRIGVMYNPAEENSVYGIRQIREIAATLDLIVIDGTVAGPAELATRANSLIATNRVDALFLSSDNTVLGAAEAAIKAGHDHGTPVFSGDSGTVERGAVASASIGYVGVGEQAASLIARVVAGEKAGDIPVHIASASEIHVNLDAARAVDLTITPEIRSQATRLYGTDKPSDAGFAYLYTILGAVLGSIAILVLLVMLRRRLSNRT